MAKKDFIRARGLEQVEVRRTEILKAAKSLYNKHFFDDISIQLIANESGFTRSNVYRYFKSKEEIYLSLILKDMQNWCVSIEKWLNQDYTSEEFANKWVKTMLSESRLLSLLSILSTKLEPNSSQEALNNFKKSLVEQSQLVIAAMQKSFPALNVSDIQLFLMFNSSLFIGTYPNMQLSKKRKTAMHLSQMPTDPEAYRLMIVRAIKVFFDDLRNK